MPAGFRLSRTGALTHPLEVFQDRTNYPNTLPPILHASGDMLATERNWLAGNPPAAVTLGNSTMVFTSGGMMMAREYVNASSYVSLFAEPPSSGLVQFRVNEGVGGGDGVNISWDMDGSAYGIAAGLIKVELVSGGTIGRFYKDPTPDADGLVYLQVACDKFNSFLRLDTSAGLVRLFGATYQSKSRASIGCVGIGSPMTVAKCEIGQWRERYAYDPGSSTGFKYGIAPMVVVTVTGTNPDTGPSGDGWPGDGTYLLWSGRTFGVTGSFQLVDNSGEFHMIPGRFEKTGVANGAYDFSIPASGSGLFTMSPTAYQNAKDGPGAACIVSYG